MLLWGGVVGGLLALLLLVPVFGSTSWTAMAVAVLLGIIVSWAVLRGAP